MMAETKREKPPEGCDCDKCDHTYATGGGGGFCPACAAWHIAVLRHTVGAFRGEPVMMELAILGGYRKRESSGLTNA